MPTVKKPPPRMTPLWVVSLFLSLTEVVTGFAVTNAKGGIQTALTAFVIVFPMFVAIAFFLILAYRPYVLYPPADYGSGADVTSFVSAMSRPAPFVPNSVTSNVTARAPAGGIARHLNLTANTEVMIVLSEISDQEDESALVGTGDALALALVQATLLQMQGIRVTAAVRREKSKAVRDFFLGYRVVVVLGGPYGNPAAQQIMDVSPLSLEFRTGGVYDKSAKRLYGSEFTNDGMDGTDWAILVLTTNPRRDGRVALLAGYTGYGTNAAAAIFANIGQYPEFEKHHSSEALIRVNVVDGIVATAELVMVRAI
jgi:hypothetical protein